MLCNQTPSRCLLKKYLSLRPSSVPSQALGLPAYGKMLKLFVSERLGHAAGVLTQSHGISLRPIGYYSCRLDAVARGGLLCLRAGFATQALLDKTLNLVLGHCLVLLAPHDVVAIFNQDPAETLVHYQTLETPVFPPTGQHYSIKLSNTEPYHPFFHFSRGERRRSRVLTCHPMTTQDTRSPLKTLFYKLKPYHW